MLDPQRTREVVKRVGESRFRRRLNVLWSFRKLVALYTARHTATVKSALPLATDLMERIQSGLSRQYGPGLAFSFSQDLELLGGMRIKVSSDVYDGSVRARLNAVEQSF